MVLSCKDLTCFDYHGYPVFSALGFTLTPGGLLILKGRNGTGKSLLLKTLAGYYKNFLGSFVYEPVTNFSPSPQMPETMYMGVDFPIAPEEKVGHYLNFWTSLWGSEFMLQGALAYFGCHELLNARFAELSSGQQKKVLLTRLLCTTSKLWLLDEPENNLDQDSAKRLVNMVRARLVERGIVIIATHSNMFDELGYSLHLEDFK